MVSDNGPQFASNEFQEFLKISGVKFHKRTAPYHPATNGQAERYVQTVKATLYAMSTTAGTLQHNLNTYLRQYRRDPHTITGQTPAYLFLGRNIRTSLDLVRPESVTTKVSESQRADFDASFRVYQPGQAVYFLSGNPRMQKWITGTIMSRWGDLHYEIVYQNKRFKRRIDQIRKRTRSKFDEPVVTSTTTDRRTHFYPIAPPRAQPPPEVETPLPQSPQTAAPQLVLSPAQESAVEVRGVEQKATPSTVRRSTRNRRPPSRYPQ